MTFGVVSDTEQSFSRKIKERSSYGALLYPRVIRLDQRVEFNLLPSRDESHEQKYLISRSLECRTTRRVDFGGRSSHGGGQIETAPSPVMDDIEKTADLEAGAFFFSLWTACSTNPWPRVTARTA